MPTSYCRSTAWPGSRTNPAADLARARDLLIKHCGHEPFASFINGVEKFVVTSTMLGRTWSNTTVIDGELPKFVTELKRQSGDDIGVHESIAIVQSLLEFGLVDELRLVIAPALHLRGRKLFDKGLPTG